MEIISVQISSGHTMRRAGRTRRTGIAKQPVDQITVAADGVEGDVIANTAVHGGPGQAVYLYAREDYAIFEAELGMTFAPGSFGENVTVDGWPHDPIRIGDEFAAGPVRLQVTSPRVPCATFASRMKELAGEDAGRGWVKRFAAARRPGWYCRVLSPGQLAAGMALEVTRAPAGNLDGLEFGDLIAKRMPSPEEVARMMANPIDDRSRARLAG